MGTKNYQWIKYFSNTYSAEIMLNRPEKRNALTDELLSEVRDAIQEANRNPEVRVIVLSGIGKAFSAGFDISPNAKKREKVEDWQDHFSNASKTFRAIWDSEKPVVAKIDGPCLGGGFDMVMACDLAIASEESIFGEPEVLFAGTCMFMLMPWLVNTKVCKQILLTGENFDAQKALSWDLINMVVPADQLDDAVDRIVRNMAKIPLGTLPYNKKLINRVFELMQIRTAFDISENAAVIALTTKSGEAERFDMIAKKDGLKEALAWRAKMFSTD